MLEAVLQFTECGLRPKSVELCGEVKRVVFDEVGSSVKYSIGICITLNVLLLVLV